MKDGYRQHLLSTIEKKGLSTMKERVTAMEERNLSWRKDFLPWMRVHAMEEKVAVIKEEEPITADQRTDEVRNEIKMNFTI